MVSEDSIQKSIDKILRESVESDNGLSESLRQAHMHAASLLAAALSAYGELNTDAHLLLITYDVNSHVLEENVRSVSDADFRRDFIRTVIKELGALKLGRSSYILKSGLTARALYNALRRHVDDTRDALWIFEVGEGFGGTGETIEDWFNTHSTPD